MICPRCEEGTLSKIRFKKNKKTAYLCDVCMTYWLSTEHIVAAGGHTLDEAERNIFVYVSEKDEDEEEVQDEWAREQYELS